MNLLLSLKDRFYNTNFLRAFMTKKVRLWSSQQHIEDAHFRHEAQRLKKGERRCVEYFHQTDDPYSQLVAQILIPLLSHYDVDFRPHLVGSQDKKMIATNRSEDYRKFCRDDAISIAPYYGLNFPTVSEQPNSDLKALADQILAYAINEGTFFELAEPVGKALWENDRNALESFNRATPEITEQKIAEAESYRLKLGYVYGSTFYYSGEWFLGVDRMNYLEERLISQGARNPNKHGVVVPRPKEAQWQTNQVPHMDNSKITLEFFPSIRSPYTAVAVPRVLDLVKQTGVNFVVRPVLPIIMRNGEYDHALMIQATYVYSDAAREARRLGMPYGDVIDCTGDPIRNCYSLFPWAREQGKEMDLLAAFLDCTFARRIDSATDAGMKTIVEHAGLDWTAASKIMGNTDWEAEFDKNLQDMYDMGLWGVPSFRVSGGKSPALGVWGQDRILLLEADIEKRVLELSKQREAVVQPIT